MDGTSGWLAPREGLQLGWDGTSRVGWHLGCDGISGCDGARVGWHIGWDGTPGGYHPGGMTSWV